MACEGLSFSSSDAALEFFRNQWTFKRSIRQRSDSSQLMASCVGTAHLADCSQEVENKHFLLYEEAGTIRMASQSQSVNDFKKTYLYAIARSSCGLELHIFFNNGHADGIPRKEDHYCTFALQSMKVGEPISSTTHLCINDTYNGEVSFQGKYSWCLKYEVVGPGKDYVIETHYERSPAPQESATQNCTN